MEGPRAARAQEVKDIIDLIDSVFRVGQGLKATMGQEFPLLLSEENADNMRVVLDDNKPVAAVNYYPSKILVEGSSAVNAASIGAVCTHPEYRGLHLASQLLDDAEEKMEKENVDVLFVSGRLNIYRRRHCAVVGGFYKSTFYPSQQKHEEIELQEYNKEHLDVMISLYNQEPTRFYRSFYEFEYLLQGSTTNWGQYTYKVFLIKIEGDVVGYIVLKIINDQNQWGQVVEYAGNRQALVKAMYNLSSLYSLAHIDVYSSYGDSMTKYLKQCDVKMEVSSQLGTVKIINFVSLMEHLKPYFAQYLPNSLLRHFSCEQEGDKYIFRFKDEKLEIDNLDVLAQLIFGVGEDGVEFPGFEDVPSIKKIIDTVFPLPFVWAGNINFI